MDYKAEIKKIIDQIEDKSLLAYLYGIIKVLVND